MNHFSACRLQLTARNDFYMEVLPDIVRYVKYWQGKWAACGVEGAVEYFFSAHGVAS